MAILQIRPGEGALVAMMTGMMFAAFAGGSVASSRSKPVRNFKNQFWWSDGKRVVLFIGSKPTSLSEIEILKWDSPGHIPEKFKHSYE